MDINVNPAAYVGNGATQLIILPLNGIYNSAHNLSNLSNFSTERLSCSIDAPRIRRISHALDVEQALHAQRLVLQLGFSGPLSFGRRRS